MEAKALIDLITLLSTLSQFGARLLEQQAVQDTLAKIRAEGGDLAKEMDAALGNMDSAQQRLAEKLKAAGG